MVKKSNTERFPMTKPLSVIGSGVLLVSALTILCMAQSAQPSTRPNSIAGTWQWEAQGFGGQAQTTLKLVQDGEKVTGTVGGAGGEEVAIEAGVYKDGKLSFKTTREFNGRKVVTTYAASLHADALTGQSETVLTSEFSAKRSPG